MRLDAEVEGTDGGARTGADAGVGMGVDAVAGADVETGVDAVVGTDERSVNGARSSSPRVNVVGWNEVVYVSSSSTKVRTGSGWSTSSGGKMVMVVGCWASSVRIGVWVMSCILPATSRHMIEKMVKSEMRW